MKKFFITLAILAMSLQAQATDSPIFWRNSIVTPHNECKNLFILHSSFEVTPDTIKGCFLYNNEAGVKLNGKPFVYEMCCYIKMQGQLIKTPASRYFFGHGEKVDSTPYYFLKPYVDNTVDDFLEAAKIGMWTDYD